MAKEEKLRENGTRNKGKKEGKKNEEREEGRIGSTDKGIGQKQRE